MTNLISETVCRLNQPRQPRVLRYCVPRSRKMSSSVRGTRRLVTTVNLAVKLMHHMSIFCCVVFAPPDVCGGFGAFNVVPTTPGGSNAGSVLGQFGIGILVLVTVTVAIGPVAVGKVGLAPAVIHWWYSVLRSVGMVVDRILPQAYTHLFRKRSHRW